MLLSKIFTTVRSIKEILFELNQGLFILRYNKMSEFE